MTGPSRKFDRSKPYAAQDRLVSQQVRSLFPMTLMIRCRMTSFEISSNEATARHPYLLVVHHGRQACAPHVRRAVEDSEATYLSVVSLWEVTIKYQLGKLPLPEQPHPWLSLQREHHGIEPLPLDEPSVARLGSLAPYHTDPFDRMLVCQALEHRLLIVTVDSILSRYPAQFLPPV